MAKIGFWQGGRKDAGRSEGHAPAAPGVADAAASPQTASSHAASPHPASAAPDLREASLLLRSYEDARLGWFWSTDQEGRLTYLTPQVVPLLCAQPGAALGHAFIDLFRQGNEGSAAGRTLPFLLARHSKFDKLVLRAALSGDDRWWSIAGSPQFDAAGQFTGFRGSGVDITEQRRSSEHASRLAMYDALTGLPNRLRMTETLEAELAGFDHHKRPCAVMLIDLDRFKQVNDTLGHPAGDALLKQVGERLLRTIGDKERIFRLGGDEFQVIVRDCGDRDALEDLGSEIIASLSQPYSVEGSRCIIGASIGVAVSPGDGRTSEDLIRNADLALYAAKGTGRGRVTFFSNELLQIAEDKRLLENDLRDALARGEMQVYYQPIVNARNDTTTGVEALVRWHHPVRGSISPALFIPIAEEANLIGPLGEWVLRKACEDAAGWPGKLRVAVNVSPIQFASGALPAIVTSALATSGLAPERLELEITEGVFLSDSAESDTMFATLKDIGVRLALDDFGTGYSSLGYLRTAPFDKIKIDQSFVRAATLPGSRNGAIIAAIVALAEALGMETTAEGVESQDQLTLIRELHVSHIQGHIYSKAITSTELTDRLETGEWIIAPSGPSRQRSERNSMYRKVGAIFGSHYRSVLVRNLSESGALIEGLDDVAVGSQLLLDFGEGQLAFARVRRSRLHQQGIEFEDPLVSDGVGGLRTAQRVSPYAMRTAGLPQKYDADSAPVLEADNSAALESLRTRLGIAPPPSRPVDVSRGGPSGSGTGEGSGSASGLATPGAPAAGNGRTGSTMPTISALAERHLGELRGDKRQQDTDRSVLHKHILPSFGHLRPDELTPSTISDWLAAKARKETLDPAIVSRLQFILGQIYVQAIQWGHAGGGAGSSMFVRRDVHARHLTTEEVDRLNRAAQASSNPQLKFIVSLLMLTGVRQRDLLEACWDDVDLEAGLWVIASAKTGKRRAIHLSRAAIDVMRKLPRWDDCPHLIANPATKKPYRSLVNSWETLRTKAELPDVEIDDLRHYFAESSANTDESHKRMRSIVDNFNKRRA